LAEDVTQAVFVVLAKKAAKICNGDGALGAWLLQCVRYAASNAIKMEIRRRKHEESAQFRPGALGGGACSANPTDVLIWQEVAQQLDDAVLKLPALDRKAVLLRYFEDRPMCEIAEKLNLTEGAAKQRLSRAVDKLRQRLSLSSIDATTLAGLLTSHAVRVAPVGLSTAAIAAATGGASAAAGISIAKGAMTMMAWAKTKIVAAVIGIIVIGGAGGVVAIKNAMAAEKDPPPAAKQQAPEQKKKEVSVQTAPPVVVKTEPQAGATDVDPATTEIKVTYSKQMQDGSWSWSTWGDDTSPKMTAKPHYEADQRTCVATVKLEPGHTYAFWLNSNNFGNFKDSSGQKAVPYLLVFETKK
jgi:RNA polymerase sigma factor (sigma-70 family)